MPRPLDILAFAFCPVLRPWVYFHKLPARRQIHLAERQPGGPNQTSSVRGVTVFKTHERCNSHKHFAGCKIGLVPIGVVIFILLHPSC